jgi:hypothetical protein
VGGRASGGGLQGWRGGQAGQRQGDRAARLGRQAGACTEAPCRA